MSNDLIIGNWVNVKGTTHYSPITFISENGWYSLAEKYPKHCCNHYSKDELIKIEPQTVRQSRMSDKKNKT